MVHPSIYHQGTIGTMVPKVPSGVHPRAERTERPSEPQCSYMRLPGPQVVL